MCIFGMHENGVGMGRNVMGWDCAGNGNRWSGDRVCLFGED